jgi:flagellar protein FliS
MQSATVATYQGIDASTAHPGQIVLLLLDGAVRFLGLAQQALARGDGPRFAHLTSRAHAILDELDGALNPEAGGDLAQNLHSLYDYMLRQLVQAMRERSRAPLERVLTVLRPLREGFEGAARVVRHEHG